MQPLTPLGLNSHATSSLIELSEPLPEQLQIAWSNLSDVPDTNFFRQFIDDLILYKPQISPTQFRYALMTILALAILKEKVDEFIDLSDEIERHEKVTQYAYLRAETAFSAGDTSQEIRESLLQRVKDVKRVYLKARERGCLKAFFRDGFTGLPCFNGRLLSVQAYEQTQLELKEFSWGKTPLDKEATQVDDAIYDFQANKQIKTLPNLDEFISYLKSVPEYCKKWDDQFNTDHFKKVFERACQIHVGGDL